MSAYTPYERQVRVQIDAWRDAKDGVLTKGLRKITKPIGALAGKVVSAVVPGALKETIERSVQGSIEALADTARWSYSDARILKQARAFGFSVDTLYDLAGMELEMLDKLARKQFTENKIGAALSGAGLGAGGILAILPDMAALFGVALRVVQQIGTSYGFDMTDPELRPIVYSVFNAGTSSSQAAKAAALKDMSIAAKAYAANWTYAKVAEKTQTGVLVEMLKARTAGLPRSISENVIKRKLPGQISFVLAPAMGAGFNYWFLSNTCRAGYMLFRELYLLRKYGDGGDEGAVTVPDPAPSTSPSSHDVQDANYEDLSSTD